MSLRFDWPHKLQPVQLEPLSTENSARALRHMLSALKPFQKFFQLGQATNCAPAGAVSRQATFCPACNVTRRSKLAASHGTGVWQPRSWQDTATLALGT